jgi:hypothetical protein
MYGTWYCNAASPQHSFVVHTPHGQQLSYSMQQLTKTDACPRGAVKHMNDPDQFRFQQLLPRVIVAIE